MKTLRDRKVKILSTNQVISYEFLCSYTGEGGTAAGMVLARAYAAPRQRLLYSERRLIATVTEVIGAPESVTIA